MRLFSRAARARRDRKLADTAVAMRAAGTGKAAFKAFLDELEGD
jgi:hypothetical protein